MIPHIFPTTQNIFIKGVNEWPKRLKWMHAGYGGTHASSHGDMETSGPVQAGSTSDTMDVDFIENAVPDQRQLHAPEPEPDSEPEPEPKPDSEPEPEPEPDSEPEPEPVQQLDGEKPQQQDWGSGSDQQLQAGSDQQTCLELKEETGLTLSDQYVHDMLNFYKRNFRHYTRVQEFKNK